MNRIVPVVFLALLAAIPMGRANAKTDLKGMRLLQAVAPESPPVARRFNIQGVVIAEMTVGEDGKVSNIEILEGRYADALQHIQKALAIQHKAYGEAHPRMAAMYRAESEALLALQRLPEARRVVPAEVLGADGARREQPEQRAGANPRDQGSQQGHGRGR